jgi:4-alpha-glucanotransferase
MLAHVRAMPGVDYWAVRVLKDRALRQAFRDFVDTEWARGTQRAQELRAFVETQAWWLDDYATFRAALHVSGGHDWRAWPGGLGSHDGEAVERLQREHHLEILYRKYLQWVAHSQWASARQRSAGVRMFGDFPFMVAADSADAWAHQHLFAFDRTVGAPPDAFSEDGQNWKLPAYRWEALRDLDYEWFRARARRMATLFDGFRVDHVVGLFRTWVFPLDDSPSHFTPADEPGQIAQGRAVLAAIQEAGAHVVAEDLGTIPSFVREALASLGIPGCKVLRWERHWLEPSRPFIDPVAYPPVSLATSGTHDTETLAQWWREAEPAERQSLLAIPSAASLVAAKHLTVDSPYSPDVRDLALELLYASGSRLLLLPVQDIFGWSDRVNVPGVVDATNWTWKLPKGVDGLRADPEARERQETLARWSREYGR